MATYTIVRLLLLSGFPLVGLEPGTVRFTPGFPISIPMTGCAVVHGRARAETKFELRTARVDCWINGGVVERAPTILCPDGTFVAIIVGLRSGTAYNVKVEVIETRGNLKETLANLSQVTGR